eukprot:gene15239-4556_t
MDKPGLDTKPPELADIVVETSQESLPPLLALERAVVQLYKTPEISSPLVRKRPKSFFKLNSSWES